MRQVVSKDGTIIGLSKSGSGPPLVLVHGTGAANPVAWPAFPLLETRFTLYAMDRRGRRASGDAETYAIEREYEDIAAVVDAVAVAGAAPVDLLGHSAGALLSLEAALLTSNVRKLILYEPAFPLPGLQLHPEGQIERFEALLEAGDRAQLLIEVYSGVMSPEEVEQMRSSPAWPARLASAHTLPREMRAEVQYAFDPGRFADLHTPTLLLLGSDSPALFRACTEAVHAALPDSRIAVMPGQAHIAMYAAPERFVGEVVGFLGEG